MKSSQIIILTFTLCISLTAMASSVDQAFSIENNSMDSAIMSQKTIDASDERAQQLRSDIDQLNAEIKDLELYQHYLQSLVESQQKEQINLTRQLEEIDDTKQGIVPLMFHMIDGLKQHIDQDLPIKHTQREQRIAQLEKVMSRADVSDAEKFRLILDAYQIEVDYGTKLGTYKELVLIDGIEREVEALYFGRVSLIARSIDDHQYWLWDQTSLDWVNAKPEVYDDLRTAFAVGNKVMMPELLRLPIQSYLLEDL